MRKIGIDKIGGWFDADEVAEGGFNTASIAQATPAELADRIGAGQVALIDVRGSAEWNESHIPGAEHRYLGKLLQQDNLFTPDKTFVMQCRTGGRSITGASIAQKAGAQNVINMDGGIVAWARAGLPIVSEEKQPVSAG